MAHLPNIYFATEMENQARRPVKAISGSCPVGQYGAFPRDFAAETGAGGSTEVCLLIYRAMEAQFEAAYAIVQEYYRVANVVVRESPEEFRQQYFAEGAGFWLLEADGAAIGCVALRRLTTLPYAGEIKRMYVRPSYRGQGTADLLLEELERYAGENGYRWLYLDTAADMKAAARFYRRKGFQGCERYNENPQAAIFMRKGIA